MKTTVSSKSQIVIPTKIRRQDRIFPKNEFDVEQVDRNEYRLVHRAPPPNQGLVD